MKRLTKLTVFVTVLAFFALPALADTLVLKSGERVTGYYEGGSARVVKFRSADGAVKGYGILGVQQIQFGDQAAPTRQTANTPSTSGSEPPRLVPGSERPPARPTSSSAANTAFTIPTGSKIVIRMIDSVNSERSKVGETFIATVD